MSGFSFTKHPASVGEDYLSHLRHALGFSISMISGGAACFVHAIFPFLFTHTGSSVIAALHTRMITNRRQQSAPRPAGKDRIRAPAA
jgi:hypothetical protein